MFLIFILIIYNLCILCCFFLWLYIFLILICFCMNFILYRTWLLLIVCHIRLWFLVTRAATAVSLWNRLLQFRILGYFYILSRCFYMIDINLKNFLVLYILLLSIRDLNIFWLLILNIFLYCRFIFGFLCYCLNNFILRFFFSLLNCLFY